MRQQQTRLAGVKNNLQKYLFAKGKREKEKNMQFAEGGEELRY